MMWDTAITACVWVGGVLLVLMVPLTLLIIRAMWRHRND